jgi:transposase
MQCTTIGLDVAKNVFQVHGVGSVGGAVVRRRLRRGEVLPFFEDRTPCLVGLEACASAHHWAREIAKLGHEVRLMPPQYVRPYVKRNKNDATDAEAICEAVTRPTMRFVPIKSIDQQAVLMLHRSRDLLIRQRTALVNALRGHFAELGIVVGQGIWNVAKLVEEVTTASLERVPTIARAVLEVLTSQLGELQQQIRVLEAELLAWHRANAASQRLATIPGVGPITATAIVATITSAAQFRSAREFSAWIGLVPRQHSSGGKDRLGGISKRGDAYLRRLLIHGARTALRWRGGSAAAGSTWIRGLLDRRPPNIAAVAIANKTARIAWAVLVRDEPYRSPATAEAA